MKKSKITFEIRTLSTCYRIVKVFPPIKMIPYSPPYKEAKPSEDYVHEEKVCEINISKDSDQYCKIICEALNKKYKTKRKK